MKYYKVLDENGHSMHGGAYTWDLPKDGKPGAWTERVEEPVLCERGYHACRPQDIIHWLGPVIWECECEGVIEGSDKIVCERIRLIRKVESWTERTARLFAADCAESCLAAYESQYPGDDRPRRAVQAARDYAEGRMRAEDMSAAWSAAESAARSAARSAQNARLLVILAIEG